MKKRKSLSKNKAKVLFISGECDVVVRKSVKTTKISVETVEISEDLKFCDNTIYFIENNEAIVEGVSKIKSQKEGSKCMKQVLN